MKSSAWTWEQALAVRAADRAYTRDWGRAMSAYCTDDLREAMAGYNEAMAVAVRKWNQASKDAIAQGG
jgi:hypothetical protein